MLRLFSGMNCPFILPFCFLLVVSPCEAFQLPISLGSLETTELYRISGNTTSLLLDGNSNVSFIETAPAHSLTNSCNGNNKADPSTFWSIISDISRQFRQNILKSWRNLIYGICYQYRNLFSLKLWRVVVILIPWILLENLSILLQQANTSMHASLIRVCGKFMLHGSSAVVAMIGALVIALGLPIAWLLYPRFQWQQNSMYDGIIFAPILEELACRLFLHNFLQWIHHTAPRKKNMHSGANLQGHQSNIYWSKSMRMLEHKYSFRVLSSLLFGIMHIGNYRQLWDSNEIELQKEFVFQGMNHAASTFLYSYFCWSPLFETRGVMASIGAHSAWNLLAHFFSTLKDVSPILGPILFVALQLLLPLGWGFYIYRTHDSVGDDIPLLHKLTPRRPSRMDGPM